MMADETGMNPDFANRLNQLMAAVSARGGTLGITSGFRTNAQQAALYARYQAGQGALAAAPGHSNHERGLAADLSGSLDLAHQLAPLYGLTFPVPGEAWHVEPVSARDGTVPPAQDMANPPGATGPTTDPVDTAVARLMNSLSGGANSSQVFNPTTQFSALNQTTPAPQATPAATSTATGSGGEGMSGAGGINNFATALLNRLGLPVTDANLKFMAAWQRAEGGSADNPWNTTQDAPGAVNFNSVGVKRYPSVDVGLAATAKTLTNGRYAGILAALAQGNDAMAAARALAASPWGTGDLVIKILGGK